MGKVGAVKTGLSPPVKCILGQVWYLIVSFPDLCHISYYYYKNL